MVSAPFPVFRSALHGRIRNSRHPISYVAKSISIFYFLSFGKLQERQTRGFTFPNNNGDRTALKDLLKGFRQFRFFLLIYPGSRKQARPSKQQRTDRKWMNK